MSRPFLAAVRRAVFAAASLTILTACDSTTGDHLTYDAEGVATDVLAQVPRNTDWARTKQPDAVLYRIELRSEPPGDAAPTEAFYSYYAAGAQSFMTATSDSILPWSGAEPQPWPAGRAVPLPLPPVTVDFRDAWRIAREAGITRVSSAVLEVNTGNAVPLVTWSIVGATRDSLEGGIYVNALTGARLTRAALFDPPGDQAATHDAVVAYRSALQGAATGASGCSPSANGVPSDAPVVCFDTEARVYSMRAPQ